MINKCATYCVRVDLSILSFSHTTCIFFHFSLIGEVREDPGR